MLRKPPFFPQLGTSNVGSSIQTVYLRSTQEAFPTSQEILPHQKYPTVTSYRQAFLTDTLTTNLSCKLPFGGFFLSLGDLPKKTRQVLFAVVSFWEDFSPATSKGYMVGTISFFGLQKASSLTDVFDGYFSSSQSSNKQALSHFQAHLQRIPERKASTSGAKRSKGLR